MLVSTRRWRAHVLLMRCLQTRRRGWNGLAGMPHGGMPSGYSDDVGFGATRLVLCLDRLPARIPHAGSDKGPTRGAALRLASDTRRRRDTGLAARRCSVGRRGALSTRRTQRVSPTIPVRATHSEGLRTSCPRSAPLRRRGGSAPIQAVRCRETPGSSRRNTVARRRVSSTIRVEARRCSSASGSSSRSCASVCNAVSVLLMA